MKRLFSLLAVAALLVCLMSSAAYANQATIVIGDQVISTPTPTAAPDNATILGPNGQVLNPQTGSANVITGNVVVTKSPTGEKVERGGKASFVAYANNYTGITWRLVSSDTQETINAAAAPQFFDGLVVTGANTTRLTLTNITDNLNGWQVECKFDGPNGPVYTAGARITVVGSTANGTTTDRNPYGRVVSAIGGAGNVPAINGQPTGAELTSGKATTLSVTAGTNNGDELHYQWYIKANDDDTPGQAIAGATSASYTPGEINGTRYYYVGVWTEKDGVKTSDTVYSETAAVTYTSAVAATPTPTPAPTVNTTGNATTGNNTTNSNPSNTNTTGNTNTNSNNTTGNTNTQAVAPDPNTQPSPETEAVTPTPTAVPNNQDNGGSSLPVVLGAIAAVALAAGVGLLVLRRNAGQ
jgi:hypothetical protein